MSETERDTCARCGGVYALRSDGTFRKHNDREFRSPCEGTGLKPTEIVINRSGIFTWKFRGICMGCGIVQHFNDSKTFVDDHQEHFADRIEATS